MSQPHSPPEWLEDLLRELSETAAFHTESAFHSLASDDAGAFWTKYANDLILKGNETPKETCSRFAHRCHWAWLSYVSYQKAHGDERNLDRVASAFAGAIAALDELGKHEENTIEIYGLRNNDGSGLRNQLMRALDTAKKLFAHVETSKTGPRTPHRRFVSSLRAQCESLPIVPFPTYGQIRALVKLLYGVSMTNQEIQSALR